MKRKLFLKVNLLTLGVVFILAISVFGIASLLAPVAMMNFTASMGLTAISGDYAYQEYERSGSIEYLARAFVISATLKNDRTAQSRFETLYGNEGFDAYCEAHGDIVVTDNEGKELARTSYRGYIIGLDACVRYRLLTAGSDADMVMAVITFAADATEESFPQGNPFIMLSAEAARANDSTFCSLLLNELQIREYSAESGDLAAIVSVLEKVVS